MDFGALPPEVNSGLLFTGPGPSALIEAATAWNTLSTELSFMAGEHTSVTTALMASWNGPSAWAAHAALSQFADWLTQTATLAERSGSAASQAVEAYSAARAATVPAAAVSANRVQLAALIATNLLGQNAAAIAATEAAYGEMWAQDAAAMYGYAAASGTATSALPAFTAPQHHSGSAAATTPPWLQFIQTIVPGFEPGAGLQNLAEFLVSPLPVAFASSGFSTSSDPVALFGALLGLMGVGASAHAEASAQAAQAAAGAVPRFNVPTYPVGRSVVAAASSSGSIGGLSVPPSWARPDVGKGAQISPPIATSPTRYQAIPGLPFVPVTTAGRSSQERARREPPEYGHVSKVLPGRHPCGG